MTRAQWQIEQGNACGCRGHDDMCPCQNNDRSQTKIAPSGEAYWRHVIAEKDELIARLSARLGAPGEGEHGRAVAKVREWMQEWLADHNDNWGDKIAWEAALEIAKRLDAAAAPTVPALDEGGREAIAGIIKAELVFCLTAEPDASVEIENSDDVARSILAALRSQPAQEPVAWRYKETDCRDITPWSYRGTRPHPSENDVIEPLYLAPPPSDREERMREVTPELAAEFANIDGPWTRGQMDMNEVWSRLIDAQLEGVSREALNPGGRA